MAPPTLWQIEVSHYNEKARWALDYKQIPHVRKSPLPGLTNFYALWLTRGGQRRFPVLTLDGRSIGDSTAIIAALEQYKPDPPLYPDDAADRARALELEDFFDEQLAPYIRRFVFFHTLDDDDALRDAIAPHASPARQRALRMAGPVARPMVRRDFGINPDSAARARERIVAAMDRLERELGESDYLVGDRFSVADLTGATLFTPVLAPPERQYAPISVTPPVQKLRDELKARRGGRWVAEMFARHRGVSAEIGAGASAAAA